MRAGLIRQRVSIISPGSSTRSTDGAPIFAYTTIVKDAWCEVETISAREQFKNDYRFTQNDKIFRIRYTTATIGTDDLIVYNSENYAIQSIINVGERKKTHEIVGRRVV
jgi:head-tail adaptor